MRARVLSAMSQPSVASGARSDTQAPGQLRLVRRALAVHASGSAAGLSSVLRRGLCPAGTASTTRRAVDDDRSSTRDRHRQVAEEPVPATPCRGRGARGATAPAAWRRVEHLGLPRSIGRGGNGECVTCLSRPARDGEASRHRTSNRCKECNHILTPVSPRVRALKLTMGDG
jgi:hypothetical protein